MNKKTIIAKAIRVITVPPFLVSILFIVLFCFRREFFHNTYEFIISIICFVLVPLLAYPLQKLINIKKLSIREVQRNLAFVFSFLGYLFAVIYGIATPVKQELLLIYYGYFFSVLVLIFANKVLKVRASGHACSIMGTLTFLVYFMGFSLVIPCLLLLILIYWSSLKLKRHTLSELILGCIVALSSFSLGLILVLI